MSSASLTHTFHQTSESYCKTKRKTRCYCTTIASHFVVVKTLRRGIYNQAERDQQQTHQKTRPYIMIAYPETEQFRSVITEVKRHHARHEESRGKKLPVLKFVGTVKLHGTNSGIGYRKDVGHWCQSRNNVLTPLKDNAGFAQSFDPIADQFFQDYVLPQSQAIREAYKEGRTIVIYGEWCGGNIQKNVALTGLPRMFVIFKVKVIDQTVETASGGDAEGEAEQEKHAHWLHPEDWSDIQWHEKSIYNIYDFPTYEVEIDFEEPALAQNKLIAITEAVERECPVGAYFNKSGVGEGVVWTEWEQTHGGLRFKVKGEEHSVSKVKTLAPIDTEKLASIQEFVDYACTENRMLQGLDYLREQQLTIEMKNVGTFLKWLINDIIKEEKDTLAASNIEAKDVNSKVSSKGKLWFQTHIV